MKDFKEFILEGKKHIDPATIGDFYQWACAGEFPNGKAEVSMINPDECEGLLNNGWFDHFDDENQEKGCKDIANFFKKNWDKEIKVTSTYLGNTWEISFELDGKEYSADFLTYFGDDLEDY